MDGPERPVGPNGDVANYDAGPARAGVAGIGFMEDRAGWG